jgi:hypothetical protein
MVEFIEATSSERFLPAVLEKYCVLDAVRLGQSGEYTDCLADLYAETWFSIDDGQHKVGVRHQGDWFILVVEPVLRQSESRHEMLSRVAQAFAQWHQRQHHPDQGD